MKKPGQEASEQYLCVLLRSRARDEQLLKPEETSGDASQEWLLR